MTREIKFRAWVVEDYAEDGNTPLTFKMHHWTPDFFSDMSPVTRWGDEFPDPGDPCVTLMQYTSLKDRNGKEIYEGDVVRIWDFGFEDNDEDDGEYGLFRYMGMDVVSLDRFRYWLRNEKRGWEGEDLIDPECCEVIGNVWENPELVKEGE